MYCLVLLFFRVSSTSLWHYGVIKIKLIVMVVPCSKYLVFLMDVMFGEHC